MRKKLGRSSNLVHDGEPPASRGRLIFERAFPAENEAKNSVLEALLEAMQKSGAIQNESDEIRMRLCLDEALVNAVMHGSGYDPKKTVRVRAHQDGANWSVQVEDQGSGFREEDLPDPNAPENLLEESGRGVHLMRSMMDEVSYWRGGRVLVMRKGHNA